MIFDKLLELIADFMAFCIQRLPVPGFAGIDETVSNAWEVVRPYFITADYFAPMHELTWFLVGIFAARAVSLGWVMANYFREAIW